MAETTPSPKSYYDKMVSLGEKHNPFGSDCKLHRDVQAAAFHHGLNPANVAALVKLEFTDVLSFSTADPNGNYDQQGVFRLSTAVFGSPVARSKVALMIRRLCRSDIFAELPPDDAPPDSKRAKVSRSSNATPGADELAPGAVAASGAGPSSGSGGGLAPTAPVADAVASDVASATKNNSAATANARVTLSSSDDDSSDSDSDSDADDSAGGGKE